MRYYPLVWLDGLWKPTGFYTRDGQKLYRDSKRTRPEKENALSCNFQILVILIVLDMNAYT
jgi:hypothetical protein